MSIIGTEMVIERPGRDERTKGDSIHVEKNCSENGSLKYDASKWKGDKVEPEVKI